MKKIAQALLIVAAAAVAAPAAADAAIGISFDFGNVGIAYSDGYYDNHHHWHNWHRGEWARYRHAHPGHYNNWRHNDRLHHH